MLEEYCKTTIEIARELVGGISESLGLETCNLERAVDFESCSVLFAANFYPPCPQPELAMGLPSHSDHCLLTLLLHNQISGLQILHQGNWVNVNPIPNSFLVHVADQLEILSNGKYKSVLHRATVNNKATRLSIVMAVRPSPETVVGPAPQLLNKLTNPPLLKHIKYIDYMQMVYSSNLQDPTHLSTLNLDLYRMCFY
ncbi:flavonol synthase/flavanone 3-hydroxylase-like [Momordica charantia]|uniref:Flavonol synthase/flavanone 3-hydroxylase-like n=1 Tax=Momordica charantia TaxID=3673 RepID=A0A6J1CGT6_MOMCH|nr:flavonol synthase/flavanone 3-hydroxylase-like [Momordica charantia]